MSNNDDVVHEVMALIAKIEPLLAGHDPLVQGAVLADLATTWLNGHHPVQWRRELFEVHIEAIRKQIEVNDDGETR